MAEHDIQALDSEVQVAYLIKEQETLSKPGRDE